MPFASPLFVNVCTTCVCMLCCVCILYCVPFKVLHHNKLQFKSWRAQPAQTTVWQIRCCTFPCACKSYAKGRVPFVFPCVGSSLPPPRQICGAHGDLLSGFLQLLFPVKSKVAEFVCKFKCLLPHAALNCDLHEDPGCRWTMGKHRGEIQLEERMWSDRFSGLRMKIRIIPQQSPAEDKMLIL